LLLTGCGSQPSTTAIAFDPCTPLSVTAPDASTEQQASIDDAIAMWSGRGVTGLARGEGSAITIEFRDAADAFYGYYDDDNATVYVNLRLRDRDQRAITVAHELGHALGLGHVALTTRMSVMNTANVTIEPTDSDEAELVALWGTCP